MFDTLDLSRRIYSDLKSFKLADLIESLQLDGCNTHNAMDDVLATGELMMRVMKDAEPVICKQADAIRDYERVVYRFRESFSPLWRRIKNSPNRISSYRAEFTEFIRYCFAQDLYQVETPEYVPEYILERAEKFMRYTDLTYNEMSASRPFLAVLSITRQELRRFKEVDVLVGDERIVISTIHKAKGLQFDRVIIMRCEDDVFPNSYFCDTPELEAESARLLYVGMTRAKRQLLLIHSGNLTRFLNPVRDCFDQDTDIFTKAVRQTTRFFKDSDWLVRWRDLIRCIQKNGSSQELGMFINDPDEAVRLKAQEIYKNKTPLS